MKDLDANGSLMSYLQSSPQWEAAETSCEVVNCEPSYQGQCALSGHSNCGHGSSLPCGTTVKQSVKRLHSYCQGIFFFHIYSSSP